jgi:hypothetical protein
MWVASGLYLIAAGAFFWYLVVWIDWVGQSNPSAAEAQTVTDAETTAYGFLGIGFLGYAVTGVLFIIWFFQAYRAAASRGATTPTWASGWAIGGWFIPLANFVIPKLVMNEVDRMSNPQAGDPPIGDRWRSLPRLEASDMWWALFVLGSVTTAIGSNVLPVADEGSSAYATGLVVLACGLVATAGSGLAGGRMIRTIGERLQEVPSFTYHPSVTAGPQPRATVRVSDDQPWIRGYDWVGYEEQTLRCLSCDKDVVFPAEQKRHSTHRIAKPDAASNG